MSTIQFDNGTMVQFDGTPTEADVNEVAQKAGIDGSQKSGNIGGKVGDFMQSVFPNKNIGSVLGTAVGIPYAFANSGIEGLKNYDYNPHVSAGGLVGDLGGDAINAASLLMAPETGGTSLLARGGVNAAIGGGLNLSNSFSQGKSLTDPGVIKDAATTALFSSLLPVLAKPFESLSVAVKGASGVTPQMENILKDTHPSELQNYIQTTLEHNKNLNTPTAIGFASSKLGEAGTAIQQKLKVAGQAVGDAIKQTGTLLIGDHPETQTPYTDEILSSFNKKLENTFGHEVSVASGDNTKLNIAGETMKFSPTDEPWLSPLAGRSRTITPADQKRILEIHNQITALANDPTVSRASDTIRNLDELIDYNQVDKFGINHDPLQGIIRSTRGEINGAIRATSPAVAVANDRFSQLKDIDKGLGLMAGKDLQRGELLLRRVFSGDKSGQSLQLLNDIKNETGVDLVKHAALAKFVTENFGDASSKTLLQQALNVEGSLAGGMKRALLSPLKGATKAILVPDTEKYATKITQGGKYSGMLDELLNSDKGRGLLRTYINNISAAHPEIGAGFGRGIENLIGHVAGN